jgi:PKD repeat protein
MATVAITPATGVVTLTPEWALGSGLAGFHLMAQDLSLGGGANQFYSVIGATIPAGGNVLAFNHYIAASGAATPSNDIGSKLTPNAYSALTSSSPDVGYGAVNFYTIHHTASADYFTTIKPGSGTSSAVTDLKPMSGPGGPSTLGGSGYFSLTFSATDLGYGANYFYYLRTDPVSGFARFGIMSPALLGTSTDEFNLGKSGYTMMTYASTDVGFGVNLMYYLRLDPVTGFTILGTLNPLSGATADVANLGSVYSNVDFVVGDVGFGANNFYVTGSVNPTGQTVSFAAQINRAISGGSFTVAPSASSALPVTLTVVAGSVGAASISAPVGGVFTVTPTAPGLITLQATQAGQMALPAFESNMLRQSFTITGTSTGTAPVFATSTPTAAGTAGSPFSYAITAATSGLTTTYTAAPLPPGLTIVAATGVITGTPTTAGTTVVNLTAQNAAGISSATLTVTVGAAATPPVITSATTASGSAGSPFPPYLIVSTGLPTSYSATGLPAGLTLNPLTGAITGVATTAGLYPVVLSATNSAGTTTTTLTITVLPGSTVAPILYSRIVNFSLRALSGPGTQSLVMGFIVQGTGKDLLVRGIGPTLASFGVTGFLVAPVLTLYSGNTVMGTNSGWGVNSSGVSQAAVIGSTALRVGAFALPSGSLDSAMLATVNQGAYTATVLGQNGATGVALAEVYDTDTVIGPKLINVSARMSVGTGNDALLAGFVIEGNTPKTVLIRGVGPTLAAFGVTGVMTNPQITVFQNGTALAANTGWGTGTTSTAQLSAAAAQVGAFPLPLGSADSALLITLPPGLYSVQLSGGSASTGIALIEIYDVM